MPMPYFTPAKVALACAAPTFPPMLARACLLAPVLFLSLACGSVQEDTAADAPAASPPRPNIVWIVAEDLSPRIPSFGDSTVATPHLSRLAEASVRYPNTFSVSGVCAPSRFAIATGMYPTSAGGHQMRTQYNAEMLGEIGLPIYGTVAPPRVKMLSQHLREHGYYCTNSAKEDYQFEAPKTAWDESGFLADYRDRAPGQPFYAVYNLEATHESQIWGINERTYRFRAGFPDSAVYSDAWHVERPPIDPALEVTVPPYLVDDDSTRNDLRRVYRNIQTMDEQVGFLLSRLEEDGLLDSTIVVWYTDHGGPLPREKRLLYDSGLRVPMMVRWPDGYRAGEIDSGLVSFVDMLPTTLAMAGVKVPKVVQGKVAFAKTDNVARDYVYAGADRLDTEYDMIRAVRDDRYKLLRNYRTEQPYYLNVTYRENMPSMRSLLRGREAGTLTEAQGQWFRERKPEVELFDTHADPHELDNLADDPAYAATRERLLVALEAWRERVGDLGDADEREMVRAWWGGQLDSMPSTAPPVIDRLPDGRRVLGSPTDGAQVAYRFAEADRGRKGWRVYTGPFEVPEGDSVRAVAQRIGYRESREVRGR